MTGRFEDHRGVIQDLFDGEPVYVTHITTKKGHVRGNHVHRETTQWTHVLTGWLRVSTDGAESDLRAGGVIQHYPNDAHAWRAVEDTECLVYTRGPRGRDFESDTFRLEEPLL